MKPYEFIQEVIKAEKVKGISVFHFLQVDEDANGKHYLTDCDAFDREIPDKWEDCVELFRQMIRSDIRFAYETGQDNLRTAVKELLNITV